MTPAYVAEIVTVVTVATSAVVTVKVALVAPDATVTLAGTAATAALLLASEMSAPPDGAADVNVRPPDVETPPVTLEGLSVTAESDAGVDAAWTVNRRTDENGPNSPAEFRARTRHHKRAAGSPERVAWDAVTVTLATNGAAIVDELSTCTS